MVNSSKDRRNATLTLKQYLQDITNRKNLRDIIIKKDKEILIRLSFMICNMIKKIYHT